RVNAGAASGWTRLRARERENVRRSCATLATAAGHLHGWIGLVTGAPRLGVRLRVRPPARNEALASSSLDHGSMGRGALRLRRFRPCGNASIAPRRSIRLCPWEVLVDSAVEGGGPTGRSALRCAGFSRSTAGGRIWCAPNAAGRHCLEIRQFRPSSPPTLPPYRA